jgi:hypothetical protein
MTNPAYSKSSPYFNTPQKSNYLDIMNIRDIPSLKNDTQFTVTSQYKHRPDLLAFDIYQNEQLWWVFAMRNKDVIRDPIYDMIPGIKIFIPQLTTINKSLGL